MKLALYQVDAFTSRLFRGNPAAVVPMNQWLPDELLQAIAAENNLAETAFVIPQTNVCPLRWFTPTLEMDLCGHATLAAAFVLLREYFPSREQVTFATRSGELIVARAGGGLLMMEFPARPGKPVQVSADLVSALGARPRQVRAIRPNFERIAALDAFAVIVAAPGEDADFVSRFFAPKAGVPEDAVTGSAHCTLIPFWAARLGKRNLLARQLSRRGGELRCELRGERVAIGGEAVEYLRGEIALDLP
jgi:predicted PhzF superfamily epimerase YddE/YHI9